LVSGSKRSRKHERIFRRTQLAVLSAQTVFNSWYLKNPPWLQFNKKLNNNDILLADAEENENIVRKLLNFRMQLIPYLYSAFAKYKQEGIPPFKPLILNYPNDKNVESLWDQFLIGDDILACPYMKAEMKERCIYLKENGIIINTNEKYSRWE